MRILALTLLLTGCGNKPVEFSGKTRTTSNTVNACFEVPKTGAYLVTVIDGVIMSINPIEGE